MAVKTFTDSTALPASDINTFLANSGLVYVNSVSVGSGVTTVSMTNAFPTTYNAFYILWTGGTMTSSSGDSQLALQVGNGGTWLGTGYYQTLLYVIRASNTTPRAAGIENGSTFAWFGGGGTSAATGSMTIINPNIAINTHLMGQSYLAWSDNGQGTTSGFINNQTAYSDFRIIVTGTGTMSGGKIYSYGYRTA